MTKFYGRLLLPYLIIVFTIGWVTSCIAAEVSFDEGCTLSATANSVWNFKVTFKEENNWWPYYMPYVDEETLQADPSKDLKKVENFESTAGDIVNFYLTDPLPEPYWVYKIPVVKSLDGSYKLKINLGVFYDVKKEDDRRNLIYGVFTDEKCTKKIPIKGYKDYIDGDRQYGIIQIDESAGKWSDFDILYVKVKIKPSYVIRVVLADNSQVSVKEYTQNEEEAEDGGVNYRVTATLEYAPGAAIKEVSVRILSNYEYTEDEEGNRKYTGGTWTVSRPYRGYVMYHGLLEGEDKNITPPLLAINQNGTFDGRSEDGNKIVTVGRSATVKYRRREPDSPRGVLWISGIGGNYKGWIPMYWDTRASRDPASGAVYYVTASAGLNMANPKQQPSCNLEERQSPLANRLILDPNRNPMWYAPGLTANGDGSPKTIDAVGVVAWYFDEDTGNFASVSKKQTLTVYDSRASSWALNQGEMINYGGQSGDRDWLESYPGVGNPDPLVTEPAEEINPAFPDDGSSSTQFVFRVRYQHKDGLPPKPWLKSDKAKTGRQSGVVLYLDEAGVGDYQPYFMHLEDPKGPEVGSVYIYRFIPHHDFLSVNFPLSYPWNYSNKTYQSLACGVYHYFFACSDDSLTFDDGSFVFEHQVEKNEWGHVDDQDSISTGLDPSRPRSVTGFGEINRPAKRRCDAKAVGYKEPFDSTIYVDRPCLVPGAFNNTGYPISAHEHPKVTCSLGMPPYDDLNIPYDDAKYGYGRFFGTIYPYSRMVNPTFTQSSSSPSDPIYRGTLAISESCGIVSNGEAVFRVFYRSLENKPPIRIRVLINNASTKSGTGQEYAYTAYTMEPSPNQTVPYNYRVGVWYQCKLKLSRGPHTYYFEAYDGEHLVRFPVRPDRYYYDTDDIPGYWEDRWVPTHSQSTERTIIVNGKSVPNPDYFDNDYFPGPYVNNPPVLSEPSVTPGTGKEGQHFRYRIKYQDADGQRPFNAYIYIQVNDRGEVRRFSMRPETPFLNPTEDHREDYRNGVYYVLDTQTIKDFALEKGIRRYYFEFTDDWGAYNDINDRVQGETTRYPQGNGNWIDGPKITGNRPPTLYNGVVSSPDGTANAATLWTFRVTYRDRDNDPPALIRVYIGSLQADKKTVLWDAGNVMQQADPSDKVYSDGAEYYFQTRLGATDSSDVEDYKQYFYAFEAYDGVDWATYKSSSDDETRSNAAGCMLLDNLVRVDGFHYKIKPLIVQQCNVTSTTQVTPTNPDDILKVWGVYTTEDVTGTNYYDLGTEPPQYEGGSITLTKPLPSGTTKAWLKYESQAPIVGPLPIDLPAPPGVIPDAQIYEDYDNNPTPVLIDDQKNGWINPDDPNDRATLVMRGVAVFEGQPSVKYVTPESPSDIASVEGVYLNPDLSGENYYEPTKLLELGNCKGIVYTADPSRITVIPVDDSGAEDADKIEWIIKVVDASGKNYYENLKWQEALIINENRILLTNRYDIASIVGVHASMDTKSTNYITPPLEPNSEEVELSIPIDSAKVKAVYVAYYSRGKVETKIRQGREIKAITLSESLPGNVNEVTIHYVPKAFHVGDEVIKLTKNLPENYKGSFVYIKYSDIRFTHQIRGNSSWGGLNVYYSPDGWRENNINIKNNKDDVTGGIIGVWTNSSRDGKNYFKPFYSNRHDDNPKHVYLTTPIAERVDYLWARCYQKGEYHIDRWNRDVYFLTEKDGSKPIQASYFFGTKMPQALGPNTPPELISGKVNKLRGSRGDLFTYSVIYRDRDGPNGQAPVYVRVYIDGVPYDMTPAVSGTPAYREGALYVYTTPDGLSGGSHKFRFEASDGAAVAWFDANGSHQSSGGQAPATGVVDIDGPWVNNPPELTDGLANPNPTSGGINPWDSVDYTVTYVDADNDEPYFYDPVRDVYDYDSNQNGIMDGPEFSGSPRLWIDSGTVDQYFTGTVAALEEDLMAPGKKRTIVAAGNPGWIPDKFAGALLQITNGAIAGRIYLIQSNTANKLIIATDDLAKDGVIAGGDNASTFRINGLLMAKADPTQQDYTRGVQFKVTVPKLAIGTHKFHFTARSREYKPQWLINQLRPHERVPYSSEARWPSTGDSPGPTVVSTPPSGNTAPVVSLTPESQRDDPKDPVFVGPMAQIALATKPNQVEAFNQTLFAQIREVRGVFLNANEFDLTSVASKDEFTRTKYNPKTANPAFAPGDTKIVLTSSLSEVAAGSELVQFGNVDSSSLLKVTPDASGVIETVLGVYLTSDPTLAGTNYYDETKPFKQGDTIINLKQSLPSGTKRVYVKYKYKPVSAGSPWPAPVYVKYFMQTSSRKFKSSDLVTFRLAYRDADNDAPSYHDSVQGYMKLVFNTTGQGRQMQLLNPPAEGETLDYRTSIPFSTDPMTLPEGQHKYHFEASDGYYVVRYPAGALGDPTANDYMITVNYKPVLTNGKVDPSIGQTATTFTFTVTYKDQDGTKDNPPTVTVRITRLDGTPWEEAREMTPATSSPNYAAGVNYVYTRKNLQSGVYKVVFEATDGDGESAVPYPASGQSDITFTVRDTNAPPEIMEVAVVPAAGGVNKLFNYTAKYRDSDGDAPIAKSDGQKDAMTLVIDPGTAKEQRLRMTKAPGEPTNPDYKTGVKYQTAQAISGKKLGSGHHTYTVEASDGTADTALLMSGQVDSTDTSLKTVIPGSPNIIGAVVGVYTDHDLRGKINYFVSADGLTRGQFVGGKIKLPRALPSGTSSVYVHYAVRGPVLLVPYFENFRAVDAAASVPELAPAITQALVGQEVVFVGDMKFPYNTETNPPAEIKNITIQVTKPDGTTVSLSGSIASYEKETETLPDGSKRDISWVGHIKVSYPKGVDSSLVTGTSFTLTASGEWTVAVSWPGDGSWDKASNEGQEVKITVGGQMRTIAVADPSMPDTSTPLVDMITVPKILGSPDIGRVFGYERALDMQIVRWDPTSKTYFRYGTQGLFPNLMPGEAIWIKPKSTYPAESVTRSMLEQGQLALGNPEAPFSELKKYRLAKAFVKDYTKDTTTGLPEPCTIALKTGWNQFGTIFFNWKRDSSGKEITPKVDVGIPLSELKVRYLNQTKSLADAAAAGWVRGYAWRWDAVKRDYMLVHPTTQGAERVLKAWYGYWIRAFVDCDLIIPSTSTYNGEVLSASPKSAPSSIGVSAEEFDAPPPAPE